MGTWAAARDRWEEQQRAVQPQADLSKPTMPADADVEAREQLHPTGATAGQGALQDAQAQQEAAVEPGDTPVSVEPLPAPPPQSPDPYQAPAEQAARAAVARQEGGSTFVQWAEEQVATGAMDPTAHAVLQMAQLQGKDPKAVYDDMLHAGATMAELEQMRQGQIPLGSLAEARKAAQDHLLPTPGGAGIPMGATIPGTAMADTGGATAALPIRPDAPGPPGLASPSAAEEARQAYEAVKAWAPEWAAAFAERIRQGAARKALAGEGG
jgi:hypothetical protein